MRRREFNARRGRKTWGEAVMNGPWAFGWTQVLTIAGFLITIGIAVTGFRTFGRWRREQIEGKRIDTAIEALTLVYESKFIFEHIRGEMKYPYEWDDMPEDAGRITILEERNARGPCYAVLKRIEANKDFFDRAWKVQVKCTALFGPEVEDTLLLMHRARLQIELSADRLYRDPEPMHRSEDNLETWRRFRADVSPAFAKTTKGGDEVGRMLSDFKAKMEALCRPIIDRGYRK
jgi:hypothetical protein